MTTNKVLSFLIASIALLVVSVVITLVVILPSKGPTQPSTIAAYNFNFNKSNDLSIVTVSETHLQLKNSLKFTPNKSTEWTDTLVKYNGNNIADGIEYHTTAANKYVCVIPFTITNNFAYDCNFNVSLSMLGDNELKSLFTYKVYDFADKTYKTLPTINCSSTVSTYASGRQFNYIKTKTSASFCLVAVAYDNAETFAFGSKYLSLNLDVKLERIN